MTDNKVLWTELILDIVRQLQHGTQEEQEEALEDLWTMAELADLGDEVVRGSNTTQSN